MKRSNKATNGNDTKAGNLPTTQSSKEENRNSISATSQNTEKKDENEEKNRQQEREIQQLKEKNREQEREIQQLKEKNREQEREIQQLKEENERLKNKSKNDNKTGEAKVLKILDQNEIESLEIIDKLGSERGNEVFKVIKKEIYALKKMSVEETYISEFEPFTYKYEIMCMLEHANILKIYGYFLSNGKNQPCILLEYCPYNLKEAIENKIFSNVELTKIIYQIAEGMKYIHFKKVIHRDLKPTNILITSDGIVKICDIGFSSVIISLKTMTLGRDREKFIAPEIIAEDYYDEKVDVYSFGVLVFYIMTGGCIHKIKHSDKMKSKKADLPSSFTDFSKKLIYDCWNFEPKDRPSFNEIVDDLNKNHYNLFHLKKSEVENVELFVKQHKEKLPKY